MTTASERRKARKVGNRLLYGKGEWVATTTCVEMDGPMFWEEGGVYPTKPQNPAMNVARRVESGEHIAACPRCGQRFAGTDGSTAEANRDLHFYGDADVPSICEQKT